MIQGAGTRVAARIIALKSETPEAAVQADQRIAKSFSQGTSPSEAVQVSMTMKAELKALEEDFHIEPQSVEEDRKSTRLNSSHVAISYAVFCLKKKKKKKK